MAKVKGTKDREKKFLSPKARLLYFVLLDQAKGRKEVEAPYTKLLELTGYFHKLTLMAAMEELERVNLVKIENRDNNGMHIANRYWILKKVGLEDLKKMA